jgi:hypothetical protein
VYCDDSKVTPVDAKEVVVSVPLFRCRTYVLLIGSVGKTRVCFILQENQSLNASLGPFYFIFHLTCFSLACLLSSLHLHCIIHNRTERLCTCNLIQPLQFHPYPRPITQSSHSPASPSPPPQNGTDGKPTRPHQSHRRTANNTSCSARTAPEAAAAPTAS